MEEHQGESMGKRLLLLGPPTLYILLLAVWLSAKNPMALDEFFAWNLLADPSFHHALGSWAAGADSGGLLFYCLLWPVVHLTHGSVLAARLVSALCYVLAPLIWWRALVRFLPPSSAAMGTLLVWLSSSLLLTYIAQVRFYTLLLLFAALATWATLRSLDPKLSVGRATLLVFSAHSCLVLIHMLGIVYSALILVACLLWGAPRLRARTLAAAGAVSWLLLLPCHTAIRNGSANATSLYKPRLFDLLRFYLKFSATRPVLLVSFLGLCWLLHDLIHRLRNPQNATPPRALALALAFFPAPLCLFLLSTATRPLGALRYLLPYTFVLCTFSAYALGRTQASVAPRLQRSLTRAFLLLTVVLHLVALRELTTGPRLELGKLQQLAAGKPVVVENVQTFFQLQYYRSKPALQFHFLLAPEHESSTGLMATVAQRGYFPNSLLPLDTFLHTHPAFLFVEDSVRDTTPWVTKSSLCHTRLVGTILVGGLPDRLYEVSGCVFPR